MPTGFKIADAYVEVRLEKDQLRADLASLPADLNGDVDRAGKSSGQRLGKSLGDGAASGFQSSGALKIADSVTRLTDRLSTAQRQEKVTADAVQLAELRLSEARNKGSVTGSRMLSLEQSLERARLKSADATTYRTKVESALATAMSDAARDAGPDADRAGQDTGDKLSRGMQLAMVRNSPMIAAAIGGALAFGAPAVLGAAGLLFAGIAAAAVHSNAQVGAAFDSLKDSVTSTLSSAAAVTVPMFVGAMGRIGAAVQGLGPQFQQAFAALGGPIDSLTTGLISMAQNAMPGLVSAVESAGPVFQGLASLMGSIGTGLGQFFAIIAQHSSAAGQVFASLGQIIQTLLPILGQLIGAGAELASAVLPPLAAVLRVVGSAVSALSPLLPAIAAGFASWKIISSVSGWLKNVGDGAGGLQKVLGGLVSNVPGLGTALGGLGAGLGILATQFVLSQQLIDQWGQALLQGGNAAATTTSKIQQWQDFLGKGPSALAANVFGITNMANAFGVGTNAMDSAQKKAQELYAAMSPLEQKQQDVTTAQNDLETAIQKWGPDSGQAAGASVNLTEKQQALAAAQDQLDTATHGVTQAMIQQANEALAMADSNFALQNATWQAKDAQDAMNQAIRQHGPNSEAASKATLAFDQALSAQAAAAGKAAADASGLTDKMELQKVQQAATLQSLLQLRDQYGTNFPAALQASIDRMYAAGVKLDWLGGITATPTAVLNDNPLQVGIQNSLGWLYNLAGQRPTPTASMNTSPFYALAQGINLSMSGLSNLRAYPGIIAFADTYSAEQAINFVARPRTAMIYTQYSGSGFRGPAATGGLVGEVVGRRFADGGAFSGQVHGPGGMFDDLIQAVNEAGQPLRVSNSEWVINGPVSQQQGNAKMAALNAGQADIVPRGRGFADGGTPDPRSGGVTVKQVIVNVNVPAGTAVITDRDIPRTVMTAFQQGLVKLERESH